MLVFKPAYNMDMISRETKKELCGKIIDRLSMLTVQELEQEKPTEAQVSSKTFIDVKSNQG